MSNLCVPLGCLLSGQVAQTIGRKRALQLVNVPFSIAFALFHFAAQPWQILLGLSLTGTAGGIAESPVSPILPPKLGKPPKGILGRKLFS